MFTGSSSWCIRVEYASLNIVASAPFAALRIATIGAEASDRGLSDREQEIAVSESRQVIAKAVNCDGFIICVRSRRSA